MSPDPWRAHGLLLATLDASVPLHIMKIRNWPFWVRKDYAQGALDAIASAGDTLMYGGKRGEAAEVFNHLARGLAVLACAPGGVTFAGIHWCAFPHPRCPDLRSRPVCCACAPGCDGCRDCAWCLNGCGAAMGRMCCTEKADIVTPRMETISGS